MDIEKSLSELTGEIYRLKSEVGCMFETVVLNTAFIKYILDELRVPNDVRRRLLTQARKEHKDTVEKLNKITRDLYEPGKDCSE